MKQGKSYFLHYLNFIVAVFALGSMITATVKYISLMPAEAYEDRDVLEFIAAEWYTKTEEVRRQGGASAYTRYHYYVRYIAVDSGGVSYSYHERESSYEKAKATADSKARIKRRVLSDGDHYITIPAEQTKDQWLNKTKIGCFVAFFGSAAYLTGFIIFIIKRKLRK